MTYTIDDATRERQQIPTKFSEHLASWLQVTTATFRRHAGVRRGVGGEKGVCGSAGVGGAVCANLPLQSPSPPTLLYGLLPVNRRGYMLLDRPGRPLLCWPGTGASFLPRPLPSPHPLGRASAGGLFRLVFLLCVGR